MVGKTIHREAQDHTNRFYDFPVQCSPHSFKNAKDIFWACFPSANSFHILSTSLPTELHILYPSPSPLSLFLPPFYFSPSPHVFPTKFQINKLKITRQKGKTHGESKCLTGTYSEWGIPSHRNTIFFCSSHWKFQLRYPSDSFKRTNDSERLEWSLTNVRLVLETLKIKLLP